MTRREKLILGSAGVLVLILAAVAIWQATRAASAERREADTSTLLDLQRQESTLALSAIEAGRGSYELARQLASDFFTGLQARFDSAPAESSDALQQVLLQRDAMITALSRSDPQSAPQLVQLLIRYRVALGEPVGPNEPAGPTPPASQAPVTTPDEPAGPTPPASQAPVTTPAEPDTTTGG